MKPLICNSRPNVTLHPLYAEEYWKLVAFFKDDPTIEVGEIDAETKTCTIVCDDPLKALYLGSILDTNELKVKVETTGEVIPTCEVVDYVCKDNPHYHELLTNSRKETDGTRFEALMFEPDCMHYFSDDFFSPTGHTAITARDLARDIFVNTGLNYQTYFEE